MQQDVLPKFISDSQAHLINKYRNIKVKFLNATPVFVLLSS